MKKQFCSDHLLPSNLSLKTYTGERIKVLRELIVQVEYQQNQVKNLPSPNDCWEGWNKSIRKELDRAHKFIPAKHNNHSESEKDPLDETLTKFPSIRQRKPPDRPTTEFVIKIIDLCTFISSEEECGILIHSNVEKQLKGKK